MDDSPRSFKPYLFPSVALVIFGWGGLFFLLNFTLPELGPRWAFYFFLTLALVGTFLPVTWFLNLRFPSNPPVGAGVIIRQAMWLATYGGVLVWLWNLLTFTLALWLAIGFIVLEWLIRLTEKNNAPVRPPIAPPAASDEP
jgi:hypothetical protein